MTQQKREMESSSADTAKRPFNNTDPRAPRELSPPRFPHSESRQPKMEPRFVEIEADKSAVDSDSDDSLEELLNFRPFNKDKNSMAPVMVAPERPVKTANVAP